MNLFVAANNGLNLSPAQRATLKAIKGMVISALMAAATAMWPLLQSQQINWRTVGITGGVALAFTLFTALDKYWTSQGDAPLAAVAGSVATAVASAAPGGSPTVSSNPSVVTPVVTVTTTAQPVSNV